MRNIIYLFFVILSFQNAVFAQKDFRVGFFGGLNNSSHKATNSILDNTDGTFIHFTGGFSVEYAINNKFSLKTGLGFEKKRIDFLLKQSIIL